MDGYSEFRPTRAEWITVAAATLACLALALIVQGGGPTLLAIGDWQQDNMGSRFPALTLAVFCLVPILAAGLVLSVISRNEAATLAPLHGVLRRSQRLLFLFSYAVGISALTTVGLLLIALILPSGQSSPGKINPAIVAQPDNGQATVTGMLKADRVVIYQQRLGLVAKPYAFAPIEPPAGGDKALRYFVEVPVEGGANIQGADHSGVIIRGGVPADVIAIYEEAGYKVARPAVALFLSAASVRWPYYAAAAQMAAITALLLLAASLQRRNVRRAKHFLAE